jgi:predicted  nucleic acid-binding Zn-ribbon protein
MREYRKLRSEVHQTNDTIGKLNSDVRKLRNKIRVQLYVEGKALNFEAIKVNIQLNHLNAKVQKLNNEAIRPEKVVQQLRESASLLNTKAEILRDKVHSTLRSIQTDTRKSKINSL